MPSAVDPSAVDPSAVDPSAVDKSAVDNIANEANRRRHTPMRHLSTKFRQPVNPLRGFAHPEFRGPFIPKASLDGVCGKSEDTKFAKHIGVICRAKRER